MKKKAMSKYTEEEISELADKVYDAVYHNEDLTQFPDDVLAAVWLREQEQEKRMKHGERDLHWRRQQMSVMVNILRTLGEDCKAVAKTKLNIQRTRLLTLADKFEALSLDARTLCIRYETYGGWKKINWNRN